jgi:hypothetical protein
MRRSTLPVRWIERQSDVTDEEKRIYYVLDKTILGHNVSPPGILNLVREIHRGES